MTNDSQGRVKSQLTGPSAGFDGNRHPDRPTLGQGGVGQYVYDALGRQTTLPAADAPNPAGGNITLGYFDEDLPRSIAQGGTSTVFSLDSAGRRSTATTTTGTTTSTLVRHYADGSDNPAWTDKDGTITRYAESIGGDLGLTLAADGAGDLTLANLHGDVVTTVPITTTATSGDAALGVEGWSDFTEYGAPRTGSTTATTGGSVGYGWLGAKQRSTTADTAGLTLMGDRLYNAATGRFTSLDPEPGGNATAYTYPNDPINMFDLDGHWGFKKFLRKAGRLAWKYKWDIALTVASVAVPAAGGAIWAYRAYRIVRAAKAARGMAGGIRATRATSWLAGRMWVGRSRAMSNGLGRISRGGSRQWRRMSYKHMSRRIQANYESRSGTKGSWTNNYHVDRSPHRGRHRPMR